MSISRDFLHSIFYLIFFLSPHIVYSIIPMQYVVPYYLILIIFYFFIALFSINYLESNFYLKPLLFSFSFIFFGSLNNIIHGDFSLFNLVSPVIAFLGYAYSTHKKIDLKAFDIFLIILYIYFYFVYYSLLPDLFFRPGFDEDDFVFDNSSSNAIPMSLNIVLYTYIIFNYFYKGNNQRKILLFSIINLILAVIQQSRIGIITSVVLFFIALFEFNKKKALIILSIFLITTTTLLIIFFNEVTSFIEIIGNLNGLEALDEDVRGRAQKSFFEDMDTKTFFFGYDKNYVFAIDVSSDILYTYNVFLDVWNRYGILQAIILVLFIVFRFLRYSSFLFPLYFFIPFLLYSMVESIFFPNFWDCLIYLLIFTPKGFIPGFESRIDIAENSNQVYGYT